MFSVLQKNFKNIHFFSCYGLVDWNKSCNFALPNNERGFGKKEKELLLLSKRLGVYGINWVKKLTWLKEFFEVLVERFKRILYSANGL